MMSPTHSYALRSPRKPIDLQLTRGAYGFKNQQPLHRLALCAHAIDASTSHEWLHIVAQISDAYVDRHADLPLDKVCTAYRDKLFEALRRAGVGYSAFAVAGITPRSEKSPRCVNPVFGLHLHLAVRVSPDQHTRLYAILQRQCHKTHAEAEAHSGAARFRPTLREMQTKNRNGTAIFFEPCDPGLGGLHGLIGYFEQNAKSCRKGAIDRHLDLRRVDKAMIYMTRDLRAAGEKVYEEQHEALRKELNARPKPGRPTKAALRRRLKQTQTAADNSQIVAKASTRHVDSHVHKQAVDQPQSIIVVSRPSTAQETPSLVPAQDEDCLLALKTSRPALNSFRTSRRWMRPWLI